MKFGSPSAGDATALREKWIQEAANERVERLKELDRILNRPLGSRVNLSKEEKMQDWQMALADPAGTAQRIQERSQVIGEEGALLEFLEWDASMREEM